MKLVLRDGRGRKGNSCRARSRAHGQQLQHLCTATGRGHWSPVPHNSVRDVGPAAAGSPASQGLGVGSGHSPAGSWAGGSKPANRSISQQDRHEKLPVI